MSATTQHNAGRGLRRSLRCRRGQSAVEFILAIPMVIVVLAGIVEFGRHYHARLTLRHAVSEAGRFAVTGQTSLDSLGNPLTRVESIVQKIQTTASGLNVLVTDLNINPPNGGSPGEVVTIDATYRFYFVMPGIKQLFTGGYVDFTAVTSVYNEPF